jgi:hypothetical protein
MKYGKSKDMKVAVKKSSTPKGKPMTVKVKGKMGKKAC